MNEFGSVCSDNANAQKFLVGAREDQFQQTGGIAGYVAASIVRVVGAANDATDFLFLTGRFRFSSGGNIWNDVDAHREK